MHKTNRKRILSAILAAAILLSLVSVTGLSVGTEEPQQTQQTQQTQPPVSSVQPLPEDHDTLKITVDGQQADSLELLPHEKIDITAAGLDEEATYQWQIRHPETGAWINIYDATEQRLSVSAALVKNMLSEDGTAALRCRAVMDSYAYLTPAFTVALVKESVELAQTPTPLADVMLLADGDDPVPEFVTVTIEYDLYGYAEDANGKMVKTYMNQAFTPYIATLKSGTDLKTSVHNPTIVGYEPYLVTGYDANGDPILAATSEEYVDIDLKGIVSDQVITVQYHPAQVPYEVHYFFQNVYDDLYTEDTVLGPTVKTTGETGDKPDLEHVQKEFPGFTSLYYVPETIAADGSTVFQVYYERDYYLMEFDCNGGYGTDTIYVRYGTYISVPNPTRMGYEFAGWNKGQIRVDGEGNPVKDAEGRVIIDYEQDFDPEHPENFTPATLLTELPAENTYYRAEWKYVMTTYSIVYWAENANDPYYSFWDDVTVKDIRSATVLNPMEVAASHSAVAEGLTDAAYFTLNEEKTRAGNPETVTVEGNASTVINVYYTRNVYTLNFSASGKCAMDEHDHTDDCEELVCGYTHSHNESCAKTLTCTVPVHTAHADACLICEKTEHDHTADCITCKKPDSHMHGKTCYGIAEGATSWTDPDGFLEDNHRINGSEQNGYIGAEQERSWFLGSWSNTGDEYIYYDGSWYPYTGTVAVGSIVPISCGLEEGTHNHSEAAGCYKDTEHKHSDVNGCYSDELHSHVDACYSWSCGEDPHIHTESCYAIACNKTEHTHTTGQCDVSRKQTVYTITGKYQQDIRKHFEIKNEDESVDYTGYWWQVPNNATSLVGGNYIVSLDLIPGEDLNFTGEYKGKNANLYYYTEVLSGDDYDVEYENKYFKEYKSIKTVQSGNLTYAEEFHPIKGFSQWKSNPAFNSTTSKPAIQENNYFYYARKTFKLNYYNYNADYGTAKDVLYQTSLNKAEYNIGEPSYPVGIEPDAYEFKGWYTTSGCYPGTEVDWENMTMPANDVTLYAKWVPVKHNVYFHYLYTDIDTDNDGIDENVYWYATDKNGNPLKDSEGNTIPKEYPIVVDHGALLGTTYSHIPVRNKYTFVGWFYMDADNKKRFAPDTMEVREDLHLFAEWMSGIDTQYEVTYVLKEDASVNGVLYPKGTTVAETAQGHLTAGKTKTFTAKAGYELLPTFADASLFPSTNSHSILMSEDSSENEFEFEYVVDEQVWYKIKYLDKSDNSVLHEEYVYWTNKAIITPKFEPIKGYIPEQYYIRKVLASDGATGSKDNVLPENEIIFYYTKDEDHGLYTVIYYTQNLDGTTYSQGPSRLGSDDLLVDGKPNVIKETIDSNKYTGFTPAYYTVTEYELDGDKYVAKESAKIPYTEGAVASGTLTAGGLEIRIYYDRIKYPYIIEYRQYGAKPTDPALQVIADGSEATKEMFEKEIIHKAEASFTKGDVVYEYYIDAPSDEELTKSMKIRPLTEDDPDTAENEAGNPNKLIFYYKQHQVEIQYHAVCKIPGAKDFGAVTIFSEYAATAAGIGGSTATEGVGYVFKGWYEDAACNIAVEPSWRYEPGVDENPDIQNNEGKKLKPGMLDTSLNVVKYYALFEPVTSQLTITKNVTGTERKDTFLFNIKGLGKNSYIDITVAISGNGFAVIDNIPIGEYQVTELTDWSKQYSLRNVSTADGKITVTTAPASITFTNNYEGSDWLTGEHSIINRFPQKS